MDLDGGQWYDLWTFYQSPDGEYRHQCSIISRLSLGLSKVRNYAILEQGEEQKFLSKGKTVEISIVTKDLTVKIDLKSRRFCMTWTSCRAFTCSKYLILWLIGQLLSYQNRLALTGSRWPNLWSIILLLSFSHLWMLAFLCYLVVCFIRPKSRVPLVYYKM